MALRFRRGTAAERVAGGFTPVIGEPIYETDTKKLYVGDGSTVGGVSVIGTLNTTDLLDTNLTPETIKNPSSYSVTSNVLTLVFTTSHGFSTGQIITISGSSVSALNGDYTISSTTATNVVAPITGVADTASTALTANVAANIVNGYILKWNATSNKWEDGPEVTPGIGNVVEDTTPQLGGDLDVNGNDLISAGSNDISFNPATGQNVVIKGNATDGSGRIVLNCEENTHGVSIKSPPHSAAATYTLVLPETTGSNGDLLSTDGSGVTSWVTPVDYSRTRATFNAGTSTIADGASADVDITGYKAYALMDVYLSDASWITFYTSSAARTADASRTQGTAPAAGSGVIAEVIATSSGTQRVSPGVIGYNDDPTVTNTIYAKIENQSGSSTPIAISITALQLED